MRRSRGFTLVEIMVAMGLAGMASIFLLLITRSQLMAYQMNENYGDAQMNTRAGMDFLENTLRRACGGISYGLVSVNVLGVTPAVTSCVRVRDGVEGDADFSAGGWGSNGTAASAAAKSDVIDVIYGGTPVTTVYGTVSVNAGGSAQVCDMSNFAAGDLVLVTNMNQAYMLRILSTAGAGTVTGCPNPGTLTFDAGANAVALPVQAANGTTTPPTPAVIAYTPATGAFVMKATSLTIYRRSTDGSGAALVSPQLMVVPDGIASPATTHANDQPLIQGVVNFEVAIGQDTQPLDGLINDSLNGQTPDEWLGNTTGELPFMPTTYFNLQNAAPPPPSTARNDPDPQYKQIRATLVVRTNNTYPGTAALSGMANGPVEDRTNNSTNFPTLATDSQQNGTPRYRVSRVTVAPRVWNLLN
jgi:prepilin-type N-terminal cleavage/methylation domain-containing protein